MRVTEFAEVADGSSEVPGLTRWFTLAAVVAAVGAAISVSVAESASAASAAPVALGVSLSNPGQPPALEDYISDVGRAPAIVMWFQSFDEPLYYSNQMAAVDSIGAIPMITWEPAHSGGAPIPLRDIAAGSYDPYLKQAAAAAVAWGKPMFIRFAHEMNLTGSPWGPGVDGNTPADYVAAWRHVVTIFRDEGATNVLWVWSPNADCGGKCPFEPFYPGDGWVDWVALDGYNYGPIDGNQWMSMGETFGSSYDEITALTTKPLMIAETASTESGGDKASWITDSFVSDLPDRLPRVRAVIWFDQVGEADWRVNSSPAALASYRAVVASPGYQEDPAALLASGTDPGTSTQSTVASPPTSPPQATAPAATRPVPRDVKPHAHSGRRGAAANAGGRHKRAGPSHHLPRWFRRWVYWRRHGAVARTRPATVPRPVPHWAWKRLRRLLHASG